MASPVLETACCMITIPENNITLAKLLPSHPEPSYTKQTLIAYNVLSIVSSSLSIVAAVYQLFPKKLASHIRTDREIKSVLRQNYIIIWLTVADLAAAAGVLIRSGFWLNKLRTNMHGGMYSHVFCVITSAWIQFFYISTYFWTFIFALDTYLLTVNKESYRKLYHTLSWGITALLCAVGLTALYAPDLLECKKLEKLIPHYISSLLPLVMTMVANPILYSRTSKAVQLHICGGGSFTDRERQILHGLKIRFRAFMAAFFICWLPSLVSVCFEPVVHNLRNKPMAFRVVLCLTSILNPLQGFLNSLLYRGVGLCPSRRILRESGFDDPVSSSPPSSSTPLLDSTESLPANWNRRSIR